jgi:prevent-host-death family protein
MYMNEAMDSEDELSVARARERFPAILEAAEAGCETVISRRGRPVAVLGPLSMRRPSRRTTLDSLRGTGKGLWGEARSHVQDLREEWE